VSEILGISEFSCLEEPLLILQANAEQVMKITIKFYARRENFERNTKSTKNNDPSG